MNLYPNEQQGGINDVLHRPFVSYDAQATEYLLIVEPPPEEIQQVTQAFGIYPSPQRLPQSFFQPASQPPPRPSVQPSAQQTTPQAVPSNADISVHPLYGKLDTMNHHYADKSWIERAHLYSKAEPGHTPAGQFNLANSLGDIKAANFYVRMVETGVNDKQRMDKIVPRLAMMSSKSDFVGKLQECFVNKHDAKMAVAQVEKKVNF